MTQTDWVKEIDLELKEIHGDKFLTWMEYGWWIKKIRQILKHEITLAQQRTEKKCREAIGKDEVYDFPKDSRSITYMKDSEKEIRNELRQKIRKSLGEEK